MSESREEAIETGGRAGKQNRTSQHSADQHSADQQVDTDSGSGGLEASSHSRQVAKDAQQQSRPQETGRSQPSSSLEDTPPAKPIRRVGLWFEHVHQFALSRAPDAELIATNVVLFEGRRTLGELDVLYRRGDQIVHRELAVKYYLAAEPGQALSCWVGPGRRDRLSIKVDRLSSHQVTLAQRARELGSWPAELPFPDETEVLLLGALFSPPEDVRLPSGANPEADQGRWYYASDFLKRFGGKHGPTWHKLDKPWWLSPEHARLAVGISAEALASELSRPELVARIDGEVERAFVVPDGWWDELASP